MINSIAIHYEANSLQNPMTVMVISGQIDVEDATDAHGIFAHRGNLDRGGEAPSEFELGHEHGVQVDDRHLLDQFFWTLCREHCFVVIPACSFDVEPGDLASTLGLLLNQQTVADLSSLGVQTEFVELQTSETTVLLPDGGQKALRNVYARQPHH